MPSAVDGLGARQGNAATSAFASLSSDDFFNLILTELTKQDPLQPNDTQALLDQLSTVYNIQSSMDLSTSMETLISRNEFASASSMIGRYVTGLDETSTRVEGLVAAATRTDKGAVLVLDDGSRVPMGSVDGVIEAPQGGES
ncbi:MAG: hypothetical protein GIKADHBN_02812 [Phycisphaerales bacterium]|nr:hypothetical protein [Phycisphaerales bacterium]MCK6475400.1 hypothetical protein [Phycisphaerales bacterium]